MHQVFHLQQAAIPCGYLSGTQDYEASRSIMQGLQQDPPAIKILFVTPEKIARSDYLMRTLDTLHSRRLLVSAFRPRCCQRSSAAPVLEAGQKSPVCSRVRIVRPADVMDVCTGPSGGG